MHHSRNVRCHRAAVLLVDVCHLARLTSAAGSTSTAGEENHDCRGQCENGRDEDEPDSGTPAGAAIGAGAVDLALNNAKDDKVACESHHSDQTSQGRDKGSHEGTQSARSKAQDESDETEASGNWVQHHDPRQCLGGILRSVGKFGAINSCDDLGRVVADPDL